MYLQNAEFVEIKIYVPRSLFEKAFKTLKSHTVMSHDLKRGICSHSGDAKLTLILSSNILHNSGGRIKNQKELAQMRNVWEN